MLSELNTRSRTGYKQASVADTISLIVLTRPSPLAWMLGIGVSSLLVFMLMLSITYRLAVGVGAAVISPLLLHEERLGVSDVLTRGMVPARLVSRRA